MLSLSELSSGPQWPVNDPPVPGTPTEPHREPSTPDPYPITDPVVPPEPIRPPDPVPDAPGPEPVREPDFPSPPEPIPEYPPDITF